MALFAVALSLSWAGPPLRCGSPRMAASDHPLIIEESHLWVVACKPPGIAVHDGKDSLLRQLKPLVGELLPVHRLDRETSGVILLAKSSEAAAELQASLASDECVKRYRGVVNGVVKGNARREGCWTKALTPKAEGRKNPQGKSADRVPASTAYRVVSPPESRFLSVVDFELGSGRTHQIRKHCAMSGHHLLGDTRYGPLAHAKKIESRYAFDGMALHAASLRVRLDGQLRDFGTPPPKAWASLLEPFGELPEAGEGDMGFRQLVSKGGAAPAGDGEFVPRPRRAVEGGAAPAAGPPSKSREMDEAMDEAMEDGELQTRSPEEVARAFERFAALKASKAMEKGARPGAE